MANDNNPERNKLPGRSSQEAKRDRVLIRDAALNKAERVVLDALRIFCVGYANPDSFAWEAGFDICLKEFGSLHGPKIGMGIMNVMRSLRLSRKSTFKFTNPACPCCCASLSEHELRLMTLFKTERQSDRTTRQTNAMILCEGANSSALLKYAAELTDHLNCFATQNHTIAKRVRRKRVKMRWSS